ncbi:MAG: hypothetical protein OHK0046_43710 [Anaerolineae bacterium]
MQISRHWRMNAQRYRLEGIRFQTGEVSLQDRPNTLPEEEQTIAEAVVQETASVTTAA